MSYAGILFEGVFFAIYLSNIFSLLIVFILVFFAGRKSLRYVYSNFTKFKKYYLILIGLALLIAAVDLCIISMFYVALFLLIPIDIAAMHIGDEYLSWENQKDHDQLFY